MKEQQTIEACPVNPFYEKVLSLRASRPKSWAVLSPATKLAALHYEAARRQSAVDAEAHAR